MSTLTMSTMSLDFGPRPSGYLSSVRGPETYSFSGPQSYDAVKQITQHLKDQEGSVAQVEFRASHLQDLHLRELLQGCSGVRELILPKNPLGNPGANIIMEYAHKLVSLETLDLSMCGLGSEGMASVLRVATQLPNLRVLRLARNICGVVHQSTPVIGQALRHLIVTSSQLQELYLDYNCLGPQDMNEICAGLHGRQVSTIKVLSLSGNRLGDHGVKGVASFLKQMDGRSTLTDLSLASNNISDIGAEALSHALHENRSLTSLSMAGNDILSTRGLNSILHGIASNPLSQMQSLKLDSCRLGHAGLDILAQFIEDYPRIRALSYSSNCDVIDTGIEDGQGSYLHKLAQSLTNARVELERLSLKENKLLTPHANELMHALSSNASVRELDLSYNLISPENSDDFYHLLGNNSVLTTLNMAGNLGAWPGSDHVAQRSLLSNSQLHQKCSENPMSVVQALYPRQTRSDPMDLGDTCEDDCVYLPSHRVDRPSLTVPRARANSALLYVLLSTVRGIASSPDVTANLSPELAQSLSHVLSQPTFPADHYLLTELRALCAQPYLTPAQREAFATPLLISFSSTVTPIREDGAYKLYPDLVRYIATSTLGQVLCSSPGA